ncbi:MAG: hypothetical protein WC393_03955 [Candidatus Nanoarchaeia archaeon]|jgi:hypothetical protein
MCLEEKICYHKLSAISQRENELKRGCKYVIKRIRFMHYLKMPKGCIGYFEMGCYNCSGKDKEGECKKYILLQ